MKKISISVTMATHNEEENLGRCLQSIKDLASEIVIADGGSTDTTVKIAKQFKARILVTTNKPNFHINKRLANDAAKCEWILQLDADEIVSESLAREIEEVISQNPIENGFFLPRANFFLGRFLKKGGVYPDYTMRLYRRGRGNLQARSVHEQAEVEGEVGYLKNDLLHYSNRTFGEYLEKRMNRYTDLMAEEVNGGVIAYFLVRPLFDSRQGFLPVYFRHLGILDGFPGFVWALFQALNFPLAYLKHIEKSYESSSH